MYANSYKNTVPFIIKKIHSFAYKVPVKEINMINVNKIKCDVAYSSVLITACSVID